MPRGPHSVVYGASLLLHAGVALAVASIAPSKHHEPTTITMREVKHKPAPSNAPPPPPPPPPSVSPATTKAVQRSARKPAPAPVRAVAETAAPAPASGADAPVADFGVALSGGVGAGGIAVPAGGGQGRGPARTVKAAPPKALAPAAKKAQESDACLEALVKPKPIVVPQPVYADRAREAGIQGKVRVELSVDETGQVVSARVIEPLGYGLDEAALEAARASRFEPATRCGKPTATTFVIGMRFSL